jgi:hypothetical protein
MSDAEQPPRVVSAEDSKIVLTERGQWFHAGAPFVNSQIIVFFNKAIRKDEQGCYYLVNKVEGMSECVYFTVEDTAYFVKSLGFDNAAGQLRGLLNTGNLVNIDPHSLHEDKRGVMYCRVLDNDRARVLYAALEELADLVTEAEDGIFLELSDEKIRISRG